MSRELKQKLPLSNIRVKKGEPCLVCKQEIDVNIQPQGYVHAFVWKDKNGREVGKRCGKQLSPQDFVDMVEATPQDGGWDRYSGTIET